MFEFLKYLVKSGHSKGHGIHSPFVYDLVSRVFRNKIDRNIVNSVEQIRKKLISDSRIIRVNDLGSGSGSGQKNERKVSDIARRSPVTLKYGILLANLAAEFGKPAIIELGTSFGISTMYLAAPDKETKVYTLEGSSEIAGIARQNCIEAGLGNIEILEGSFEELLPGLALRSIKPGLVFIDGDHRKKPVLNYFEKIAEMSDSNTVIIIDDINYSREMRETWEEIKLNDRVSVTIDLFRMGICFFRKGINHNNYIIRY